ncbi:MAG: fibronectin type III domain-containing protein [Syntrophobacterales bacterium]
MKPFYYSSPKWEQSSLSNLFRLILICLTALLILPLSFPKIIHAAQITLEWDAVIHPLLEGYVVHYGTYSRDYDVSLDVGNWTSCTIADLEEDETYYFAVTAYSTEGEESDFSNEVSHSSSSSSNSSNDSYDVGIGGGCFIATAADG